MAKSKATDKPSHSTPKKRRDWKATFLEELAKSPNVASAARIAGKDRSGAYKARADDPEFAAKWDEAIESAIDGLAAEAFRRAHAESDTLTIFLLKSHRPEIYRESTRQEISGPNGGPIQTQLETFNATLAKVYPTAGLPSSVVDAEAEPAALPVPAKSKPKPKSKPAAKPKSKYKPRGT